MDDQQKLTRALREEQWYRDDIRWMQQHETDLRVRRSFVGEFGGGFDWIAVARIPGTNLTACCGIHTPPSSRRALRELRGRLMNLGMSQLRAYQRAQLRRASMQAANSDAHDERDHTQRDVSPVPAKRAHGFARPRTQRWA